MSILYATLSLGILGLVFGILLGFASKAFEVKVDPKIPKLRECLPGANCGGCGFAGCDAYAEAVVMEGVKPNLCSVGGAKTAEDIGEVLGIKVDSTEKMTAFVKCNGNCKSAKARYDLEGVSDCLTASLMIDGGFKACSYGCLGLGSCVNVCEFGALDIVNGIAKVNIDKCTNCGACINICPKGLIESVPVSKKIRVECNNIEIGRQVKENCSSACIGCKLCERNCPKDAVHVVNNLAKVDYDKCVNCQICTKKCPTGAIKNIFLR
ncbi:RnfABCDGE type electron transport complex subunit B [Clostridium nigeriense]|uniref:RnfABCDGE type electron transport complex subunit B n=1 Tax=Clostridium nigeriense TaxID=1805470 RepID=UPI003D356791